VAAAIMSCQRGRRIVIAGAGICTLVLAGPLLLHEPIRAPVRLAVLPFDIAQQQQSLADSTAFDVAGRLARMKSSGWSFTVIPVNESTRLNVKTPEQACRELSATHVLHGKLQQDGSLLAVRAAVTEACSQQTIRELALEYDTLDASSLAFALAGVVTRLLHLPYAVITESVNTIAERDYVSGLAHLEHDSEVDEAIVSFERAAALDSHSSAVHASLADAYRLKDKLTGETRYQDAAIREAKKAESLNPDSAPVCRIIGKLRLDAGQYAQATEDFSRAIELDPGDPNARRWLARTYQKMDRFPEAIQTLLRAIAVQPNHFRSYQELGSFYCDLGQYEKAVEQFKKLVELTRNSPESHVTLAVAYIKLGQYAQAEQELRTSLTLHETVNALVSLGAALVYEGRDAEASVYYRRAATRAPGDYLPWKNLGDTCRRMQQQAVSERAYRTALKLARTQLARNPQNAYIRSSVGYLLARLGDSQQAEFEIDQSLRFPPLDVDVLRQAALTYEVLGQRKRTLAVLQNAPQALITDLNRYPDTADLDADPRFMKLMAKHKSP
jgi:tetratricopeptide (TPR) repeat protein/TolB-like protein